MARKGRLVGDVLLSSAFCCYTAAFDQTAIGHQMDAGYCATKVPLSDGMRDPLDKLMSVPSALDDCG